MTYMAFALAFAPPATAAPIIAARAVAAVESCLIEPSNEMLEKIGYRHVADDIIASGFVLTDAPTESRNTVFASRSPGLYWDVSIGRRIRWAESIGDWSAVPDRLTFSFRAARTGDLVTLSAPFPRLSYDSVVDVIDGYDELGLPIDQHQELVGLHFDNTAGATVAMTNDATQQPTVVTINEDAYRLCVESTLGL